MTVRQVLFPAPGREPLLVTAPDTIRHVVVLQPAPTEPRAGRYGVFAQWSRYWAQLGVATIVSDPPGSGDSLVVADPAVWSAQRAGALRHARLIAPGRPVHELARGAACALFATTGGEDTGGEDEAEGSGTVRIAMSPPTPQECRRVAEVLRARQSPDSPDQAAEPGDAAYTLGAASLGPGPGRDIAGVLDWAANRLESVRWDLELRVTPRRPRAGSSVVFGDADPLGALEVTRAGIGWVLGAAFDELANTANWS
ncbi:hypothetical protein OG455_28165 [Kitasatospora sp. NBC_01287]|uniref:hypothetical protein n=1 Tax=Kitasatospora sp. NBC_01287 TaxID=2903573 RepID=UPI002258273B|nr:hypothetical protein [Kitasatospora sp. NBC_01287]MCX4749337.1 hypothetical protein [Kitasatospora sp. NBC_01287]